METQTEGRTAPSARSFFWLVALIMLAGGGAQTIWAQEAQSVPAPAASGTPWHQDFFYENATHFRGKDETGDNVGLSKFRNTLQYEADRHFDSGWKFNVILRGTFDGVYQMNSNQFGDKAGGPVQLGNSAAPIFQSLGAPFLNTPTVPYGSGINNAIATGLGLPPSNAFGINTTNPNAPYYTPNSGLQVLGARWHTLPGEGLSLAVPVRPCNVDRRGCANFGDYGNLTQTQLEFPEFNKRLDFLRELYVRNTIELANGQNVFLKIGRQQVVWGRTDLFRVLDVINPVDYSRNNIYDELQDIRFPQWIATAEYRLGATKHMQDANIQLVWNFDKFRPDDLGQCGTPNSILDAGCLLRSLKSLWDYGGTVGDFAAVPSDGSGGLHAATDFGPHQEGIRNVYLPGWSLNNTQLGLKFEGVTAGGLSFSLNALTYRQQLPSLRGLGPTTPQLNMFTGQLQTTSTNLAFDVYFPRVKLIGGSLDFQIPDLNAAIRYEIAATHGEEFPNTSQPRLFSQNNVLRSVIGVDRPTAIKWINPVRDTLISAQLFYQKLFNYEQLHRPLGPIGNVDWEQNFTATLLIKSFLLNDRLSPQIITAHDFRAQATAVSPSIEWVFSDKLKVSGGANVKFRGSDAAYNVDDGRAFNPYPPFTTYSGVGQPNMPGSWGLSGLEPLGAFRAGPIGAAWKENEIFLTLRYSFL